MVRGRDKVLLPTLFAVESHRSCHAVHHKTRSATHRASHNQAVPCIGEMGNSLGQTWGALLSIFFF